MEMINYLLTATSSYVASVPKKQKGYNQAD